MIQDISQRTVVAESRWPHGHANRYAQGCRCPKCTKAATLEDAKRILERLSGNPRSVPTGPARLHAQQLVAAGLTPEQIARESGMPPKSVRELLHLNRPTMWRRNEAKILAVPLHVRVQRGDVSALGATRRLRALYALGHLNWRISEEAGLSRDTICALVAGQWTTLKVAHDTAIREAYDRMSMSVGTSWKTQRLAERMGWDPPLAWDDETIDAPEAAAHRDAPQPKPLKDTQGAVDRWLMGESVVLSEDDKRKVIAYLMEWSPRPVEAIAAQLEMLPATVSRSWERTKKCARAAGKPVRRRAYITPIREKTRSEAA